MKREKKKGAEHHSHALLETSAVAGAVVGATVGSIAGPVGAAAGAAIGTALGAVTGNALDQEEERHSLHDHELDKAIGVEGGTIGRPSEPPPPPTKK